MRADAKPEGLRQAMSWLHTWASLVLGWLLFVIFFMGTLSFLRLEIDEWMRPELHHSAASVVDESQLLDVALQHLRTQAPDSSNWSITLPGPRQSALAVSWRKPEAQGGQGGGGGGRANTVTHYLNAQNGEVITPRETRGGGFLYRFHFELYSVPRTWARWLVIVATAAMLVAIVSGVITHKKIFSDFFTFRPQKGQRSWLDAHNASAVLSLPFHFVITLSGLLLFMNMILPQPAQYVYEGNTGQFFSELRGGGGNNNAAQQRQGRATEAASPTNATKSPSRVSRNPGGDEVKQPLANAAATLNAATLAPLLAQARQQWGTHGVGRISIDAPSTPRASLELREGGGDTLSQRGGGGTLRWSLSAEQPRQLPTPEVASPSFVRATYNILTATHLGRFAEPAVRWLLVIAGLSGVLMVASGMVLWVVKRLPQRIKEGRTPRGHRLVEVLNVAAIAGLPLAVAAYWWANRLLPVEMAARADAEIRVFFLVWLAALIHAAVRPHRRAWLEQMALAAALFALLPALNALTGGAGLLSALSRAQWGVVSVDIFAWLLAAAGAGVVWWLRRAPVAKPMVKAAPKTVATRPAKTTAPDQTLQTPSPVEPAPTALSAFASPSATATTQEGRA